MGLNNERQGRPRRPWFSTGRPTREQIADADALIDGLHKARAVSDFERQDLHGAVNAHRVTDPVIDVDELSKYGSKRISNLINVVESSPGYGKLPEESLAALKTALDLAEEAEARLRDPLITRRTLLTGFGLVAAGSLIAIGYSQLPPPDRKVAAIPQEPPTLAPAPTATLLRPTSTIVPTLVPTIIPTIAPTVKVIPPDAPMTKKAELILEQDYLGPEAIKKAFGISLTPDQVPKIPFSGEQLEWSKELGQFLVLRVNTLNGRPFTASAMEALLGDRFYKEKKGKIFDGGIDAFYYTQEAPRPGWALVSKDILSDSLNKDYLGQTLALEDFVGVRAFPSGKLPDKFREALGEYDNKKRELDQLFQRTVGYGGLGTTPQYKPLSELKLNQIARHSFSEISYDLLIYFQNNSIRLLSKSITETSTLYSRVYGVVQSVGVGGFSEQGLMGNVYKHQGVVASLRV